MKIEAVTVSVGYSDFLAETIPANLSQLDRWTIVTDEQDKDTFKLCHKYSLPCLTTDDFYRDGKFNKGRAIQRGLNAISCQDWCLHLDADIVLPPAFRKSLESAHLDPSVIYGADRMMVKSWEDWQTIKRFPHHQSGYHAYTLPDPRVPVGARWVSPTDGYVPIGFFQLWHGSDSIRQGIFHKPYPSYHGDAARSDVRFGLFWDRRKRAILPEVFVYHLESEVAGIGANWNGRRTKRFGPPQSSPAAPSCS